MGAIQQILAGTSGGAASLTYATWNPADKHAEINLTSGNLTATSTVGTYRGVRSTLSKTVGKWYWEYLNMGTYTSSLGIGTSASVLTTMVGGELTSWGYTNYGGIYNNDTLVITAASYRSGDTLGFALNLDGGATELRFYKNNALQYTASGITVDTGVFALITPTSGQTITANFGASTLAYTPPAGHNAGLYV